MPQKFEEQRYPPIRCETCGCFITRVEKVFCLKAAHEVFDLGDFLENGIIPIPDESTQ